MALRIETFSNVKGGNAFYKALTHPGIATAAWSLVDRLASAKSVAIVDPLGFADGFAAIFDLSRVSLDGIYVQSVSQFGHDILGQATRPVTDLAQSGAELVLLAAFDADRAIQQITPFLPKNAEIVSFDTIRLADDLVGNRLQYLDPLNFATNWAFFRDSAAGGEDGHHSRIVTVNYWSAYGAKAPVLVLSLFGADGAALAHWRQPLGAAGSQIVIDSREVRQRFGLPAFEGQLFMHLVGGAGHDVVKYALDTWEGADGLSLSCTHDSNMWPADFYAGLPAPRSDEHVTLWLQNCFPVAIPAGEITLNLMGDDEIVAIPERLEPFATIAIDIGTLMPAARWPQQIEIAAGRHIVRPRYEVECDGRRRIAHPNVERTDLRPDPAISELGDHFGKGFLLPAPILPSGIWRSTVLPTPMARSQEVLPIAARLYDSAGQELVRHAFGRLGRQDSVALELDDILFGLQDKLASGGHVELLYDFEAGCEADGWLHALFRYEHRTSGHAAETSFGAHIFNTIMTWRDEPQSYAGRPPGLSTRLFLRLGHEPFDTLCHLIYPASKTWRPFSTTSLLLQDGEGNEVASRRVQIPCSGSFFWRYSQMFGADDRARAGSAATLTVRDTTCRLFGYHGLISDDGRFSLDHMFGF